MKEIPKRYNPQEAEANIYKLWQENKFFTPEIKENKKPFVIIMPPPNANAPLHIGSAVFITIEDIMIRYNRMKGIPSLWVPGADHAGIATQVVYEKELKKQGKTKFDLGREKFFKKTYEFTLKNIEKQEDQIKKLGASCDWTRKRFTLEPDISESVYYTFKKLYNDGLIYRGDRIINWCASCGTALSDLEVEHIDEKTNLWYIKYPLKEKNKSIVVATTRPETMLGDTAVAVNPKDERCKDLIGKKVILPLMNREIPIIADKNIDPEFGTGAVKITPAHAEIDYKISKEHDLQIINVIGEDGKMTEQAGIYKGLTTKEARKKILEDLEKQNLIEKTEDYQHNLATCERCGSPIEPLISKQWFIKTKPLAKPAIEAVKKGKIKFTLKKFEKIYYHWMNNIEDWCISRQLWWGHRIPVWYCECGETIVDTKEPKECPKCKSSKLKQDPDTLDTWFSSGQWPFNVFNWPKETKDFKYFYPTTVMETGWDILFFWVARMIMLGIYCTGKPPFKEVYLHGLVRDKQKRKMSKSKNNTIDPLSVIKNHGADSLRMALVFSSSQGRDIIASEEKIIAQKRFVNKIWNAARFFMQIIEGNNIKIEKDVKKLKLEKEDEWILNEFKKTSKKVDQALEKYNFHIAAEELYDFFWYKLCAKTIENVKDRIYNTEDQKEKNNAASVLYFTLLNSLKLLHPFMPFITEEIYQLLPETNKKALIIEEWPEK
ncbi:MAG: valine--tRNA ligase [Candidatus Portnoybacteria bacterium]|nr:valine--tRNA ligase [Candidatus Portnoybacteria bacterium]